MIPEIGHFALILATSVAIMQAVLPLVGVARNDAALMSFARVAACVQAILIVFAFGCLAAAFLGNDFSVAYVASNSNSKLPAVYRFTAVWGGHEGSMLLWMLMLGGWSAAVAVFSRHLPLSMVARVLSVLGMVSGAARQKPPGRYSRQPRPPGHCSGRTRPPLPAWASGPGPWWRSPPRRRPPGPASRSPPGTWSRISAD